MKKVKFVYSSISHEENPHIFTIYKNVDEEESLRNITISIIKEAIDKGYDLPTIINDINPESGFQITTDPDEIGKSVSDRVYLMENGEVHFLTFYESLRKDWTLEELDELNSKELLIGNIDTVYIAYPIGLGGGPHFDLANILITAIISVIAEEGVKGLAKLTIKNAKNLFIRNEIKKIVEKWIKFNGISDAKQIRKFIEKKENWSTQKLAVSLGISERFAMVLLNSVGYELSDNSWFKSYSTDAEIRRKNWIEKVEKY
jgi:predicted XRE-type DNA-binding protein